MKHYTGYSGFLALTLLLNCSPGCTGNVTLAWEYQGSEPIWSTPLVLETGDGEGLILMGDEAGFLNAVDLKTGTHKWRFPTRQDIYSSPVASKDGKRIMFGSTNYFFYCLDREGNLLWKFPTGSRIKSDPAVFNGMVYFGSYDKTMYALSVADGSVVWTFPPKAGKPKPGGFLLTLTTNGKKDAGDKALKQNAKENNGNKAANLENKKQNAADEIEKAGKVQESPAVKYETGAFSYSSPIIADKTLFVGNMDGYLYALDAKTGVLRWRTRTGAEITSTPVVDNGLVYVGSHDKNLYALDIHNGKVKWKFQTKGKIMSAIRTYRGKVFFGSFDTDFYCLDADSGKLAWKYGTKGPILSAPAFHDDRVFFGGGRGDHNFYGLDVKTGKQVWIYKNHGGRMDADAVVYKSMLFMACGDRELYAFKLGVYKRK
ncbi:MAG: PQQ-like beta-propeller repeat protein [Deltaproteobacteria bacterium]|nr:PQQ-like beta-propeller repeat protein [Deltaproteobacteria bacterium]